MKKIYTILIAFILFGSFNQIIAQNDVPMPPVEVKAELEETNSGLAVVLNWAVTPNSIKPTIFNIYYTYNDQEMLIKAGHVQFHEGRYYYSHLLHNLEPGTYNFTITAVKYYDDDTHKESKHSKSVRIQIPSEKHIKIVSVPKPYISVGEHFIYEIIVHSEIKCEFALELIDAPEGMRLEKNILEWIPEREGQFKVTIRAYYPECEVDEEDIQTFHVVVSEGQNEPFVRIHMEDGFKMELGDEFHYQVKAESNINCPILFEFETDAREWLKFEENGFFIFQPEREGIYRIVVRAYLECHPDVHDVRTFTIVVGEGNHEPKHCAWINGTVHIDTNAPVEHGIVKALRLDRNEYNQMPIFAAEIIEGHFEINVPEGNYALDIIGPTFYPEWYQDAEYITEADRITVECEDEITIHALVEALPVPDVYTASGRVLDAETGNPVYAEVEYIPVEWLYDEGEKQDPNHRFATRTNEEGYYHLELPDNFTYVAYAVSAMNSVQYEVQYYDRATNPMEADLIELNGDLENIDFQLVRYKDIRSGFSGQLFDENDSPITGKLVAYCVRPKYDKDRKDKIVQTVETNSDGIYHFDNLVPGDYVVLSIPSNKDYVPGYYNLNDFVVLKWKDAAIIQVDEAMIDMMFDFKHKKRGELGLVVLSGSIFSNNGGVIQKGDINNSSSPVAGAFVFVIDKNGNVSDFAFTDSEGNFTMDEVASGNVKVIADKVGMEFHEETIETDYEEKSNMNLQLTLETATNVEDVFDNDDLILFPSPALNEFYISNSENVGSFSTEIYNLTGTKILELQNSDINTSINIQTLNTGVYLIKLKYPNRSYTKMLSVIK